MKEVGFGAGSIERQTTTFAKESDELREGLAKKVSYIQQISRMNEKLSFLSSEQVLPRPKSKVKGQKDKVRKNRQSARRTRNRKKVYIQLLQQKIKKLQNQNQMLRSHISACQNSQKLGEIFSRTEFAGKTQQSSYFQAKRLTFTQLEPPVQSFQNLWNAAMESILTKTQCFLLYDSYQGDFQQPVSMLQLAAKTHVSQVNKNQWYHRILKQLKLQQGQIRLALQLVPSLFFYKNSLFRAFRELILKKQHMVAAAKQLKGLLSKFEQSLTPGQISLISNDLSRFSNQRCGSLVQLSRLDSLTRDQRAWLRNTHLLN